MEGLLDAVSNCPDCGASDSVRASVCDLCLADLGERRPPGRARRAEASPGKNSPGKNEELRFADAPAELSAAVELAEDHRDGSPAAGVRVERLLGSLRAQFLRDLGEARLGRAGAD